MSGSLTAEGRRAWAWLCAFSVPLLFAALAAVGFAVGTNPGAVAFLAMPWVWVTALALFLYRRDDAPARDALAPSPVHAPRAMR